MMGCPLATRWSGLGIFLCTIYLSDSGQSRHWSRPGCPISRPRRYRNRVQYSLSHESRAATYLHRRPILIRKLIRLATYGVLHEGIHTCRTIGAPYSGRSPRRQNRPVQCCIRALFYPCGHTADSLVCGTHSVRKPSEGARRSLVGPIRGSERTRVMSLVNCKTA